MNLFEGTLHPEELKQDYIYRTSLVAKKTVILQSQISRGFPRLYPYFKNEDDILTIVGVRLEPKQMEDSVIVLNE